MRHIVIPDVQCKPGHSVEYLSHIGKFILKMRPATLVCLGDFADMSSLSSYDVGKKSFEGRRYIKDIEACHIGMTALLSPLWEFNKNAIKTKHKTYNPRLVLTLGNHEARISKAVDNDPKLDGVLSLQDLQYEEFGWEVYPFLEVVVIDNIAYSHYFTSGVLGRPCTSAQALLTKKHQSCIAGHQQGLQIAMGNRADGTALTAIIAGSAYEHDEDYMGPQGNKHWRGILVLNDVRNGGEYDPMPVTLKYLRKKYGS